MKSKAVIIKETNLGKFFDLGFEIYPIHMGMGGKTVFHYFAFPEKAESLIGYYESPILREEIAKDEEYREYLKSLGIELKNGHVARTEEAMRSLRMWQFYVDFEEDKPIGQICPSDVRFPASFVSPEVISSTEQGKELLDRLLLEGMAEIGEMEFREAKKPADA